MAGDSGSHPAPGAGRAVSPPVFTYWGERAPLSPAAGEPVAPLSLPEAEDGVDAEYQQADAALAADDAEATDALPAFEVDPAEELGFAPLGDFTGSGEGAFFAFAPEPEEAHIPASAFIFPDEPVVGAGGYGEPVNPPSVAPHGDPVHTLADRLEHLARQLRAEGTAALAAGAVAGDRFDALMAGLLTGYLAAQRERA